MSSSPDLPSDPKYSKLAFIANLKISACDIALGNAIHVGRRPIAFKASDLCQPNPTNLYRNPCLKLNNTPIYLDLTTDRALFDYPYDAVHRITTPYFALILGIEERHQPIPTKGPHQARSPPNEVYKQKTPAIKSHNLTGHFLRDTRLF